VIAGCENDIENDLIERGPRTGRVGSSTLKHFTYSYYGF